MFLIFDTETTGLPQSFSAPSSDSDNWPRMVQIAWQLHDEMGQLIDNQDFIIKPEGYDIPFKAIEIHGITNEMALAQGHDLSEILEKFNLVLAKAKVIAGHNIKFDIKIVGAEMYRKGIESNIENTPSVDTAEEGKNTTRLPGRGAQFKFPKLEELHQHLFGKKFDEAHNAAADVNATARCFFELIRLEQITAAQLLFEPSQLQQFLEHNTSMFQSFDIAVRKQVASHKDKKNIQNNDGQSVDIGDYFHFHNHTVYSVLQSTSHFKDLIVAADKNQFAALAMVDFGNMYGAFKFINEVESYNQKIKEAQKALEDENTDEKTLKLAHKKILIPIIGCEFYLSERYQQKQFTKDDPDRRTTQLLFAKNLKGYQNLSKISSEGYLEGYYAGFPRVSKAIIGQYKEHLIAITGSLSSDICNAILNQGEKIAEEIFIWWKETFQDDFYIQIQNHGLKEELYVNQVLLKWAEKYQVKVLAQNETFYSLKEDAPVHDIVVCIKENEFQSKPIGKGYGTRYGLGTQDYYLKDKNEIKQSFANYPEAFDSYTEFLQKFSPYTLKREVLLPKFDIPNEFLDPQDTLDGGKRGEMAYLRHLSYEGAAKKYEVINDKIRERIDFELEIIAKTGYPGYFLIVQDFCNQARKMGVSVGPGRGSAAGSVVAYCTGITNVDPIKYDLLFERFLNPERVSMPDIDIDFDDEGRGLIIDWVMEKYGQSQVAQIITYGTLGGKSAIKDAGRILEYPLADTTQLSNLLPATPGFNLSKAFQSDEKKLKDKYKFDADIIGKINKLKGYLTATGIENKVIDSAYKMEGGIRNTGIHACGVIITPEDIRNLIPVTLAKDSKLLVSQFDNSVVESAGLLKMDFLGLKTLTIIKNAINLIKIRHKVSLIPEEIPLDDPKTYQLFKDGRTVGIFQYESAGMQKYLKDLQPDKFEDLIAMNALYRPGPLQYIPNFIARKNGKEKIEYDLPEMEEYLSDTYGITVYQEQVMLLSQKLAGFTKGEADTLRKAMGKKIKAVLDKMKPKFLAGGKNNGLDEIKLNKIWTDWEAFAEYAFNKSHSTCYALIAYHTAYLKANYPAEYMAAVLNNSNTIDKIAFYMHECKNSSVTVLGPDVNESDLRFTVNKNGDIRFGLSYIKGVGEKAVANIIEEREKMGVYTDIYDFAKRVAKLSVNKKAFENFAYSGAFDGFSFARAQYFHQNNGDRLNQLERLIKYGNDFNNQKESNQTSLFGSSSDMDIAQPNFHEIPEWPLLEKLNFEKETIGIFLTGHPLDLFQLEIKTFCTHTISELNSVFNETEPDEDAMEANIPALTLEQLKNKEIFIGGIITKFEEKLTKKGDPFGVFTLTDYDGSMDIRLFKNDYAQHKPYLGNGYFIFLKGAVKPKFGNLDHWEFSVQNIQFLSDLRENKFKNININIPITILDETLIAQIQQMIEQNHERNTKSTCAMNFVIIDYDKKIHLNLFSKTKKIYPDDEFFKEIENQKGISYSLN